jgi:hypothetical protein
MRLLTKPKPKALAKKSKLTKPKKLIPGVGIPLVYRKSPTNLLIHVRHQ